MKLVKVKVKSPDLLLALTRYGLERVLYRPSVCSYKNNFPLKDALLFDMWFDLLHRPTRDIDLLRFGLTEEPLMHESFREICAIGCDDARSPVKTDLDMELRPHQHLTVQTTQ